MALDHAWFNGILRVHGCCKIQIHQISGHVKSESHRNWGLGGRAEGVFGWVVGGMSAWQSWHVWVGHMGISEQSSVGVQNLARGTRPLLIARIPMTNDMVSELCPLPCPLSSALCPPPSMLCSDQSHVACSTAEV